mmetsp:Transcript_58673/g.65651  ORF Transcript_58673/g.65651 Transcript_58673/m.65651 type:complete len:113 (+) Transcript_58673:404-742(+)
MELEVEGEIEFMSIQTITEEEADIIEATTTAFRKEKQNNTNERNDSNERNNPPTTKRKYRNSRRPIKRKYRNSGRPIKFKLQYYPYSPKLDNHATKSQTQNTANSVSPFLHP